jgi:uncharacterized protein YkwD
LFKLPRMSKTTKVLVTFILGVVALATSATAWARSLAGSESSLLHAINTTRLSHGLAPLRIDPRLERTAQGHSTDMLRGGYFAHGRFAARMRRSGALGPVFGEDLAWGPDNARWVVSRWLASPEHRANLLRPGFRRVGVGAAQGTFVGHAGALVVTADFAGH